MLHDDATEFMPLVLLFSREFDCSIMSMYSSPAANGGGGSFGTYRSSAKLDAPELFVYRLLLSSRGDISM